MLIRFFRSNNPAVFIFLPLIAVLIWVPGFMEPSFVPAKDAMPLYELLEPVFLAVPWLAPFLGLVLILSGAFLVNYIVNEDEVLGKQSYLPALFYILLMSNNKAMLVFHPLMVSNLFLLLAIHKLMSSYRKDHAFSEAFDAGLLISLATLFYFPCIFFFLFPIIAFIILRTFNWREWLISFFGMLIPYLFCLVIYFWNDALDHFLYDKMFLPMVREKMVADLPPGFYLLMALGWGILLLSFGKLLGKMGSGTQRSKKSILLLLWFFILSGLSLLIAPEISSKYFSALAIPSCIFYTFLFLNMRREWIGEILFLLFFGTMIVNLVQDNF